MNHASSTYDAVIDVLVDGGVLGEDIGAVGHVITHVGDGEWDGTALEAAVVKVVLHHTCSGGDDDKLSYTSLIASLIALHHIKHTMDIIITHQSFQSKPSMLDARDDCVNVSG